MSNDEGSLEFSAMVWLDDEGDEWMYSLFVIHDGDDEQLQAWGASDSKNAAVKSVESELANFFKGV